MYRELEGGKPSCRNEPDIVWLPRSYTGTTWVHCPNMIFHNNNAEINFVNYGKEGLSP